MFYHAPVEQILTQDDGASVAGVRLWLGARAVVIGARQVVVACGGLETARLLLASREGRACGLGNERDLVGRFYQCHLEGEIGTIHFTLPQADRLSDYFKSADGIYCRRYLWLSPEAQRREQLAGLVLRPAHANIVDPAHRNPVLSAMYLVKNFIVPEYARKMTSLEAVARAQYSGGAMAYYGAHLRNIVLGAPRLAGFGADWLVRRVLAQRKLPSVVLLDRRASYPVDINAEQEPNPDSRVRLGTECDALGMPRLVVDWQTSPADHDRLARGMAVIAAALAPSGAARLDLGDDLAQRAARKVPVGGHHIGTARMGAHAGEGVCDANAELFGTRGVFLAGAAIFPTSGFANPTLVMLALALRLARHLAKKPLETGSIGV